MRRAAPEISYFMNFAFVLDSTYVLPELQEEVRMQSRHDISLSFCSVSFLFGLVSYFYEFGGDPSLPAESPRLLLLAALLDSEEELPSSFTK